MTDDLRVAHVVRRFGGLTEPFIATRLATDLGAAELWTERLDTSAPAVATMRVRVPWIAPGTAGDRIFHRIPWVGPILARPYAKVERRRKPDVIHAHYLTTGYLIGRRTRAPLVVSAYGFDATVLGRQILWRHAYRELARRASAVIVEGPHMAETVGSLGFHPGRVHVVPIAAALGEVAYRAPDGEPGPVRLVSCGRLVEKKGHHIAIAAFAAAGLPAGSHLTIVGDGPRGRELAALARSLGVTDCVSMVGALDRAAWLDRLRQSDLLIAASVTAGNGDQEGGAPTTILDAQASGVPVVGSTHCDIPFLVADGVTGYLGPEGSADGIAAAMLRAMNDRRRWAVVAANARRQIEARHTDEAAARLLADVHHRVAGR
jgi:colanic acid/amylovoran biosynthesis glycosyltransferase